MSDRDVNEAALQQPPFAHWLGIKMTHVSRERVTAELAMREEFNNRFNIMHGGALMALADNLGGTGTMANLKPGPAHDDDREQDQFLRRCSDGRHSLRRMHAIASRPNDHGLADEDHARRRQVVRRRHADAASYGRRALARRSLRQRLVLRLRQKQHRD